jgi:hypothetical protein
MKTTTAATVIKPVTNTATSSKQRIPKHVHFILCSSCYSCASYLDGRRIETCPSCRSNAIESMPIASDEMFAFGYDAGRGVTIEQRFAASLGL